MSRGLEEKAADWLAFLVKALLTLGILLPGVAWLALPWIAALYDHDEVGGAEKLVLLAWLLSFTVLAELPRQAVGAAFQGTRRMTFLAKTENGQEFARVFCIVIGALITFTPLGAVVGMLAGSTIGSVLALDLYRQARASAGYTLPSAADVLRRVRSTPLRPGMRLAVRIGTLRSVDALAFDILPTHILRTFAGAEWVAYFRVTHRIMNVPVMFMQGFSRTALPAMSELGGLKDMRRFRRDWLRVTLFGGGLIATGILACLSLIPLVTAYFYPSDYAGPVFTLALILAVGFVPNAFCLVLDTFFIVADRLKVAITFGLTGIFACTASAIVLSLWFPETGTAWGYTIAKVWPALSLVYIAFYFRSHRGDAEGDPEEGGSKVGEGATA
jgi:O-antigen/teichoic acid export membrane protein